MQTNIDGLRKTLSELTDEYDLKNKIISQSEHEINQRTNKIKNKKGELDLLNKKLSLLKEKTGVSKKTKTLIRVTTSGS